MENERKKLFSDFPAVTRQEWLDKITVDLKGADFNKKLVWRTNEGFNVQPFYMQDDVKDNPNLNALPGKFPFVRGNKTKENNWFVRQNVCCCGKDAKEVNAKLTDLLTKGVDSFGLCLEVEDIKVSYLEALLANVPLDKTELNFKVCNGHAVEFAKVLKSFFETKGVCPCSVKGSIDFDPIGRTLKRGVDKTPLLAQTAELVETMKDYPFITVFTINSLQLKNAGSFCYQEAGYALSWGNEYMNAMVEAGIDASLAARKIRFNMGVDGNYFMEIAKFRAFRALWAYVVREYGVAEENCYTYIAATTSEYNKTLFDSYVNLLRTQTETMSSALAGVDSIVVTPFDTPYETPTDFSERIARNQQLLLKEESHFGKIVDVSAGSYYIEELTKNLSNEAWKLFLKVEEEGGFKAQVQNGNIQNAVNQVNADRRTKAAQRREFILGSNQFPNFTETSDGKTPMVCCCCCSANKETTLPKLDNTRLSSDFETLRLQTEKSGKKPKAFMLTIGDLKWRQARAQFSCNFLACAGYEVIDNLGFETVEEGVEAAVKAGADIVVICSSDEEYATYAVPAFKALNGRALFIVAGAPACAEELKAEGIEYFIHVKVNQLETLKELNAKLGI